MKRVLITGASGFFGQSLTDSIVASKDARYFGVHFHDKPRGGLSEKMEWIRADLKSAAGVKSLLKQVKATHLVHLAWRVPPKEFWTSPENTEWRESSVQLFKEFCELGGEHFVGIGTLAEYDAASGDWTEESPSRPATLYGRAKAETYAAIVKERGTLNSGCVIQWVRVGYFFGEREPKQKFFSFMANRMLSDQPIQAVPRETVRDYGHVRYAGTALYKLLSTRYEGPLNLSGGTKHSIGDILERMARRIGYRKPIEFGAYKAPVHEPFKSRADLSRMKKLLNVDPAATFFDDLDRFVDDQRGKYENARGR